MEELRMLVEAIAGLPTLAAWVLVGYLCYKIAVVGSIYGLIRFLIEKAHDYAVRRKTEVKVVDETARVASLCIKDAFDPLIAQLHRVAGKDTGMSNSQYIHRCSVEWLRQAIDDKVEKDRAANEARKRDQK